jgi:hypothetical protein
VPHLKSRRPITSRSNHVKACWAISVRMMALATAMA